MITKASRFQIIKPLDCSWDEFGAVLRELSYWTTKMCNAAIQEYWDHHNRRLQFKAEAGRYPSDAELGYSGSFRNYVYHKLRELYPLMASNNVSQTNQFALKRWQADRPEVMRLAKSVPSFRLGTPVQVANANYTLKETDDGFTIRMTLLSQEAPKSRFQVAINPGEPVKKVLLRRIASGEYKQGAMQIIRDKRRGKWFCVFSYSFEPQPQKVDDDRVMGVALAGENAVYWAFSHSPKRGGITWDEIVAAEQKIAALERRRKSLQHTAGPEGHGRRRKLQPTEPLAGKVARIRETINHKYSRRIVDLAVANRCRAIVLPELDGLNGQVSWPWADLVAKIKYKAEEKSLRVEQKPFDKARNTCSKCGYCDPANVGDNKEFLTCKHPGCGARINLEYNLALALARF